MTTELRLRAIGAATLSVTLVMLACGKSGTTGSGTSAKSSDGARAKGSVTGLTYAPGVVTLERRDGLAALKEISTSGDLLLFAGGNRTIASLKPGSVLLIKGLLAKKVLAVEADEGDIAVLTEPAALTDVVQDGHLTYDYPVRFASNGVVNTALAPDAPDSDWLAGDYLVGSAYAASPADDAEAPTAALTKTFDVKGWTVEVTATPQNDRVNLKVKASREGNGFKATVIGDGYMQNFDAGGDLTVEHGKVEQLEMINKKMNGTMNFTWSVKLDVADRPFQSVKIDVPVMVNVPLAPLLGGLPFFLVIDGAVLIKPGFGAAEEISYGEFRITYDGTQRFKIHEGTVELLKWDNYSKVAPVGLVVAFAAPRIELTFGISKALKTLSDFDKPAEKADKLFDKLGRKVFGDEKMDKLKDVNVEKALDVIKGNEASATFELITSSGTSAGVLSWGPCQQTDIYISASVAANAKLLGQSANEAKKELWKKHIHASKPEGVNCT